MLYELVLLVDNPGHGHPLRPEAKLTSEGEYWAELALSLEDMMQKDEERRLARLNWTLPTLRVAHTLVRFTVLRNTLASVQDSALSLSLRQLESTGWLERQVDPDLRPPEVAYITINRGRVIADLLLDMSICSAFHGSESATNYQPLWRCYLSTCTRNRELFRVHA